MRIAGKEHAFPFVAAHTHAFAHFLAILALVEAQLTSAITGCLHVNHARVCVEIKAASRFGIERQRTCKPLESVDNQDSRCFGSLGNNCANLVARHAGTTFVDGFNTETVEDAWYGRHRICAFVAAHVMSIIEIASILFHVNHVAIGLCRGLCRVVSRRPANCNLIGLVVRFSTEACHGKRLNDDILASVNACEEADDTLVNGTRHEELEVGVVTETHVSPVLVAEHLEEDGRELCIATLAIVPVVEVSTIPCAKFSRQVFCDLRHHQIGKVTADKPGKSCSGDAVVEASRVDAKRTDKRVVCPVTCITMYCHI